MTSLGRFVTAATRQQFFVAFGSRSFTEPVDEAGSLAQSHAEVP